MEFTGSQKLLVHNVLFNFLVNHPQLSEDDRLDVEDVMHLLKESLDGASSRQAFVGDGDDDDFDDEEDEVEEAADGSSGTRKVDIYVDAELFVDLPPVRVVNSDDQSKSTLVFFEDNDVLCFELSSKDRHEDVFEDVKSVTRRGKFLEVETATENFEFHVSKFPVEWTSELPVNKTFGL